MAVTTPLSPAGAFATKAVELHRSGRQDRAKAMILKAARAASTDGDEWQSVVNILRTAALDTLLSTTIDQYARAHPDRAVNWAMLGRAFRSLERPVDATDSFERATSLEPTSAESWFEQAWAAVDAERSDSALRAIEKLSALDPDAGSSPLVVAFKSISLCRASHIDEAVIALRSIAPGQVDSALRVYLTMAYLLVAQSLVERNRAREALGLLEAGSNIINDLCERAGVAFHRGLALLAVGDFKDALSAFETANANTSDPYTQFMSRLHMALALEKLGDFPRALEKIDQALTSDLNESAQANALIVRARLLTAMGNSAEALRSYEKVDPDKLGRVVQAEVYMGRAVALVQVGRSEDALRDLVKGEAANDDPAAVGAILFWRATALRRLNHVADALEVLERAEAQGLPDPLPGLAGVEYGILLQTLGRTDEALARVERALSNAPAEPVALALLQTRARILANSRRLEDAFDAYAVVQARAPKGSARALTLLEMAEVGESLARNAEARDSAATALDELPVDASFLTIRSRAYGVLVRASMNLGDKPAALDALDRLLTLNPGVDVPLPLLRIRLDLLLQLGQQDRALETINELATKGAALATHPYVLFVRAEILRQLGREPADVLAAMRAAARVPQQLDGDALAWLMAGMALAILEQWPEAERALKRVEEIEPIAVTQTTYVTYRALVERGLGHTSEALAVLDTAKNATGIEGTLVNVSRGQVLLTLGRYDESAVAFQRAIELQQESGYKDVTVLANTFLGRAQALLRLKRLEEAMEGFDESLHLLGNVRGFADVTRVAAMVGRAFVHHRQKRADEALKILDDAIKVSMQMSKALPYRGLAWWCKGVVMQEQEKGEEALTLFRRAGREGLPGNMASTSEGDTLLGLEDWDGALTAFEAALSLATDAEQKFDAYSGKGRALHRRHDMQQAVEAYRAALALDCDAAGTDPIICLRLGETYDALGRHRAALHAYRRGWQRDRSSGRSPDLALGVSAALIRLGENSEALAFLEEAESVAKPDERLTYNRAVALIRLGEIEAARGLLARAADKGLVVARELLRSISRGASGAKPWLDYWFGKEVELGKRVLGVLLLSFVGFSLLVPIWLVLSDFLIDWKILLAAPVVALLLLVLPGMRSFALSYGDLKVEASPSTSDASDAGTSFSKMSVAIMVPGSLGTQSARVTGAAVSVSDDAYAMASSVTLHLKQG
jgi:tetratricopeptide (TPR) repeat protein